MDKINWINGQTPINQANLNQMQTNMEKSAVAISSTQPTTGEKVWIKKGKNLCNAPYTASNKKTITATQDDFYETTDYFAYLEAGRQYVVSFTTDGTIGDDAGTDTVQLFLMHNKTGTSAGFNINTNPKVITPTVSGMYYVRLDVNKNGCTHSFWNIQVEQGTTATSYEAYIEKEILVKNGNGVFESFINVDEMENTYSTAERKIGTWIDGKPLYRKVIQFGPEALNASINHGITNISEIVDIKGSITTSNGGIKPLVSFYNNNNNIDGYYSLGLYLMNNTTFDIVGGDFYTTNNTIVKGYIIVEYTKTTN